MGSKEWKILLSIPTIIEILKKLKEAVTGKKEYSTRPTKE